MAAHRYCDPWGDSGVARKNRRNTTEREKLKIRASMLLNRLESFAKGKVEMSAAQVQAARIVIGKVIPDLKSVEVTGDPDKPIKHDVTSSMPPESAYLLMVRGQ